MTRPWMPAAMSLLVYTIITAVIGRDVLAHLGTMIANDPGDPLLNAAILEWNATQVPLTSAWYQFPIFYPTRDALTFSEHLLGLYVIASPLYWITGNAAASYNIVLLLTYPLCGMAMYGLAFRLTRSTAAAFIAGLAFAFAPYRVSQLPHIQMLATFWAPLALLGLHAYIDTARRRWLALYGAAWVLQGAANGYALVMFSVLVGLWTLWFVVSTRKWHALAMIAVTTVVAVLPLAPVLFTYVTVHSQFGFVRDYWEIRSFSADIAGLLCAPSALQFWGWLRVMCRSEGELFPGFALMLLVTLGLAAMVVRSWRSTSLSSGKVVILVRRFLLLVAAVYTIVILVLLVWGPFMFDLGPLRVQASTFRKPIQLVILSALLALALAPGVRALVRQSRTIGFYLVAAVVTWSLTLGPITTFMDRPGIPGPYHLLMSLPGVDSLRVPARFWLMTTICLSVVAGFVAAEFLRGRTRRVTAIAVVMVSLAVLGDGWIDRIPTAKLPPRVPGEAALAGKTVFVMPPDFIFRDIQSVFRAVEGGWQSVNGYSGHAPSYYHPLTGAGRAASDDVLTPFRPFGDLYVVVARSDLQPLAVVERQPGATQIASDDSLLVYRLPKREASPLPRPEGERLRPRELRSECSTALLEEAIDDDESTLWQCELGDQRDWLLVDLGDVRTVGSVVNNLGSFAWVYPGALHVETSADGAVWSPAWGGSVREQSIRAGLADPKHMRIVVAFPPRPARFIRMRAEPGGPGIPWAIAELEVWSSSAETH